MMRPLYYAQSENDLRLIAHSTTSEVVLAPRSFSRRGTLSWEETLKLAQLANELKLAPVLEWDALMTEGNFLSLTQELSKSALPFAAVRVRDAGAAFWLKAQHPEMKLQLLLEAGHHNLAAVQSWIERLGPQLQRVCLSPELTLKVLTEWRGKLSLELEVLGLGPLLLFHSGRALLSPLDETVDEDTLVEGASEESPHKGFLFQENRHGTLMFHPKDLCLLERWDDLAGAGIDVIRLDHRQETHPEALAALVSFVQTRSPAAFETLRSLWHREWMRGYFDVNKSDVLFPKLKNQHLRHRDGATLGEVLEGKRDSWLAVRAQGDGLKVGQELQIVDPKGGSHVRKLHWMKNEAFEVVTELKEGEVGFVPWFPAAPSTSVLLKV